MPTIYALAAADLTRSPSSLAGAGVCIAPQLIHGLNNPFVPIEASAEQRALAASFLPGREGTFAVTLRASDGCQTFEDTLRVEVRCANPPVANAGADLSSSFNATTGRFEAVHLDPSSSLSAEDALAADGSAPDAVAGLEAAQSSAILRGGAPV